MNVHIRILKSLHSFPKYLGKSDLVESKILLWLRGWVCLPLAIPRALGILPSPLAALVQSAEYYPGWYSSPRGMDHSGKGKNVQSVSQVHSSLRYKENPEGPRD